VKSQNPILSVSIKENQNILSTHCVWARSSYRRLVGLLAHEKLEENESLLIEPCKQVHTFFMSFGIDVVFLDSNNRVLKVQTLKPWRLSSFVWQASKILEVPYGRCERAGLHSGQTLLIKAEAAHA
jgi:uncharacterized protein